ncbi:cytosolic nonspecific dipeptidase, putative [Trypanosoma equiperdum]|uniref:Peptidase M20/M25/M40, putative n=1 Tax=Trypanosoma equiperdum TaxID=5694 RepID=A0A1G4I0H8_TRYEQ|nr:cytosolic nonspecific dipeptidase, putative [Trypanosoma equiperdum]
MSVDWNTVHQTVSDHWDTSVVPGLSEFLEVPNQSPHYDKEWATNGHMKKAMDVLVKWIEKQPIKGMKYEVFEDEGLTPFLVVEIEGTEPCANTLLMYGHVDKQPPLLPWGEGLHPYKPVYRDGNLYGRGSADDGYAAYLAISAVAAVQKHGLQHGKVVVIIEASEESGSMDLPHYLRRCKDHIGNVDLLICLDSGGANHEQLWLTTALRGLCGGVLTVETMREGMHSGMSGGVVPDSFRIARMLLERIEDTNTGNVKIPEAICDIPEHVIKAAEVMRSIPLKKMFALLPGVAAEADDNAELALRSSWKAALTVVGDNLPDTATAGNVNRAKTTLRLSLRIPPVADAEKVSAAMKSILEADPPYNAKVNYTSHHDGTGSATPALKPWLAQALHSGCETAFGKTYASQGVGGTIPFVAMLQQMFPEAQFLITGVVGPRSNIHGPNECLNVPFAKGVTTCVARVIAEHFHATPKLRKD